jgi:hypothetical protein
MIAAGILYMAMYAGVCWWTKLVRLDDLKSMVGKSSVA